MGIINIVKTVKDIHKNSIILIKIGKFYNVYGKDAFIISHLFNYKIKEVENKIYMCGFPANSMNKILSTLENKKIDYIILDRRNNYDVEDKMEYKNLNNYDKIYEKAKKDIILNIKIEKINKVLVELKQNVEIHEILEKIERVINETRKVQVD